MTEAESDGPKLLDVLGQIGLHDHLCLIYESHEEHLNAPVRSIWMGLDRGEKCIYIADEFDDQGWYTFLFGDPRHDGNRQGHSYVGQQHRCDPDSR